MIKAMKWGILIDDDEPEIDDPYHCNLSGNLRQTLCGKDEVIVKESDAASLVQLHDDVVIAKYRLSQPQIRIGRDPDSDIVIDDKVVSQEHAVVEVLQDPDQPAIRQHFIRDLNSTNGTFVNDEAVKRRKLSNQDLIRIGWTTFKFVDVRTRKGEKTLKIHKSWIPGVYYTKE